MGARCGIHNVHMQQTTGGLRGEMKGIYHHRLGMSVFPKKRLNVLC